MLDIDGLKLKRFPDIIKDVQTYLDDNNTGIVVTDTANETANNLGNTFTLALAQAYQFLEKVYYSYDIYSAEGEDLENLVSHKNLIRFDSTSSKGFLKFSGSGEGVITNGFTVSDNRGRQVKTSSSIAYGAGTYYKLNVSIPDTITAGTVYSLDVSGITYSYTAQALDTKSDVADNLLVTTASHTIEKDLDNNLIISAVNLSNLIVGNFINITQGSWELLVIGESVEKGSLSFSADTLNILVSNNPDITSVTNPEDFTVGREKETNTELRNRFLNTNAASGKGTYPAVRKAVSDVVGVDSVKVINNPTSVVVDGIPEHSYEVIVSGGNDNDIADTIFITGPAGIQAYGSTVVNITDSEGFSHNIGFSRPTDIYIFVNVDYELDGSTPFPVDGEDQIKEAIIAYGNSIQDSKLIPSKFNIPVYNVAGVGEVEVTLGSSPNVGDSSPVGGYSKDRLVLGDRDEALFTTTRVTTNQTVIS